MEDEEDIQNIVDLIAKHQTEQEYNDFAFEEYPSDDEDVLLDYEATEVRVGEFSQPYIPKTNVTKLETFPESAYITDYEKAIIDSCTNPQLKQLLLLNRQKNLQLKEMYRKVKELLLQCLSNIAENENNMKIKMKNVIKRSFARIWKMGIPYFKTADGFPCPPNPETLSKAYKGELLFYDMTPVKSWTSQDINRLLKGVSFYYKANKETGLKTRLAALEKNNGDPGEISELIGQIEELKNIDLYPELGTEKNLNWPRIALRFLRDKYCVEDCQIFWKVFVHPKLNKGHWEKEELDRLNDLVAKHNCQNWDLIAEELGTGRSGFIVCRHYLSKVNPPKLIGRFTPEEDRKLIQLVKKYTEGGVTPWCKIARQFNGRTRGQLLSRYKYYLNLGDDISRDKFTEAEDILLLALIDRFGHTYSKCAQYFPHRTMLQLKSRYNSTLRLGVKKGYFDEKEDETILEHVEKHGQTWHRLAPILGRRNDQVSQRYKTLVRFLKMNPWATIHDAPRRKFFGESGQNEFDWLKFMASKLKNSPSIPTLNDVERLLQITPKQHTLNATNRGLGSTILGVVRKTEQAAITVTDHPSVNKLEEDVALPSLSIDDVITEYFVNSLKSQFEETWSVGDVWQETAAAVGNVLATLQAHLHVPVNLDKRNLDAIDLKIVECLVDGAPITSHNEYELKVSDSSEVRWAVPPTLNTVVGMRNLLLKNQSFKSERAVKKHRADYKKEKSEEQMFWCINSHLTSKPPDVQLLLKKERQLFTRRYFSLFKLPAVMSLIQPHHQLTDSIHEPSVVAPPRTYGKKNKTNFASSQEPLYLPTTKPSSKLSMAETMKRKLHETLNNLTPKPVRRRTVFAKKESTVTITELPEETPSSPNDYRLKETGRDLIKEVKRAKVEEAQEEQKPCINQQDVEDLKMLEAILSTKSEELEENFDID